VHSQGQSRDKRRLRVGLDSLRAIGGAHPRHCVARRIITEYGHTRQRSSGPAVTAEAADLYSFPGPSPGQCVAKRNDERRWIGGQGEVRPIDMVMPPRGMPATVEVQPVVRWLRPTVGIGLVERSAHHFGAVGKHHRGPVPMQFMALMVVLRIDALRGARVEWPEHSTLDARNNNPNIWHGNTVSTTNPPLSLRSRTHPVRADSGRARNSYTIRCGR